MLTLLLLRLWPTSAAACRYMQMQAKLGNLNSPPPPPPLDMWDKHYVARWMSHDPQLVGINTTAFQDANIDGAALHELWLERNEPQGQAALASLTADADLGARLRLFHRLRGITRDAMAPAPPPPPPPFPSPPPSPGAPRPWPRLPVRRQERVTGTRFIFYAGQLGETSPLASRSAL